MSVMRSPSRVAAAALLVPMLILSSCKGGQFPGLNLDQFLPKVTFKKLNVTDLDFKGLDTNFVFNVSNPNPIKVKLSSFSYDLDLAGTGFLNGDNRQGLALEARGDSKLVFPVATTFKDILSLAGDMKGKDSVPFAFTGKIGFNTPLGEVKIPYNAKGDFPVLQVPKISFKGVKVGKLNLLKQTATLDVQLGVTHKGGSKMGFQQFDYALTLGGRRVLEGLIAELATVGANEEKVISLPVTLNLLQVGATVVAAITKKSKLDVGLDANLNVATPFGVVPLHIDQTGKVQVQ